MEKIIDIKSLIGIEVRSRTNAEMLRNVIQGDNNVYIIDFKDVTFVSRSFADELCNIMDENNKIRLTNETFFVKKMIDTVLAGRKRVRQRDDKDDIITLSTIDELNEFMKKL